MPTREGCGHRSMSTRASSAAGTLGLEIRRQIQDCALFFRLFPLIARSGWKAIFRREWKLAAGPDTRTCRGKGLLVPVVIDEHLRTVRESNQRKLRDVQWTQLPAGGNAPHLRRGVSRLLSHELAHRRRGQVADAQSHTLRPHPGQTHQSYNTRQTQGAAMIALVNSDRRWYVGGGQVRPSKRPSAARSRGIGGPIECTRAER